MCLEGDRCGTFFYFFIFFKKTTFPFPRFPATAWPLVVQSAPRFFTFSFIFFLKANTYFFGEAMAERGVDISALPKEVRDQLAELDLELSEGKTNGGREGGRERGSASRGGGML